MKIRLALELIAVHAEQLVLVEIKQCITNDAKTLFAAAGTNDLHTLWNLDLDRFLPRLPGEELQAVKLFYLQDRSIEDVAAMMDLPEGTVKSHLHRARRRLAKMMEGKS